MSASADPPPWRAAVGGRVSDLGYAAGWQLVRALPEAAARAAFDAGARYGARRGGPEQLRRNLARVVGVPPAEVPDRLVAESLASYARYWRETFRLPTMDHRAVAAAMGAGIAGKELIDAGLAAGRGVILALPHTGNWDVAGLWLARTHGTFATVAERLRPESLYRRFLAYRESLGFEVLPLTGADRPPFEVLTERLADNRVVCLMADRDLTRTGVPVTLFGEATRMPAGPARLAVATGASLLATCCHFEPDGGWGAQIHPPLPTGAGDVAALTQQLADRFAEGIAARPQDWHMLQPQWIADLPAPRRARLAGA